MQLRLLGLALLASAFGVQAAGKPARVGDKSVPDDGRVLAPMASGAARMRTPGAATSSVALTATGTVVGMGDAMLDPEPPTVKELLPIRSDVV
ncbi:hypothetical protein DL764_003422 [Monosporascus ibericus]|uniref:Uncharacterized protein n=1 Tax=Monosporascus ibericus TaxID=155417 RepID=A0A4V1XBF4_9PEZI|nr:hypothetical protein DL764_003422 [Monosporascus ibericus]